MAADGEEPGWWAASAAQLGLTLDERACGRLTRYLDLLERWNRAYNLTAVRDRPSMRVQHVLDCLAVIAPLRRQRPGGGRLLDVGSGGGLPGAVIAITAPEFDVTCIDAVGKKAAFVQQAAGSLELPNLRGVHGRVESGLAGEYHVITSRAFASLADFVVATRERLAPGGCWAAMKGREPADEIAAVPADVEVFHVEHLEVPGLFAERCLVWMRPKLRYPPGSSDSA